MPYWLAPQYWSFEPVVVFGVELAVLLYLLGRARQRLLLGRPASRFGWRDAAFFAALATILLALDSPVDTFARQLFWVHMTQHLLLLTVAAPLLVAAAPWLLLWRGVPLSWRRPVAAFALRSRPMAPLRAAFRFVARPATAWVLAAADLWLWHLPPLYDLTLRQHLVHHLEHALFLGLGVLFWSQVIDQPPLHARLHGLQRAAYVLAAMFQAWPLAIVIALASSPLYDYSRLAWRPGGISALTDQQIAGGIMWVPGSITYAVVVGIALFLWLEEEDQRAAGPSRAGADRRGA